MDTRILKNSYVVAILVFIILCVLFYLLGIGYQTKIENGKVVKKFSWKYPLAIALIVWAFWYFYLYPPSKTVQRSEPSKIVVINSASSRNNSVSSEKRINMNDWN